VSGDLVQTVIVSAIALGAAGVLFWQVIRPCLSSSPSGPCAKCASGKPCAVSTARQAVQVIQIRGLKKRE
jgi:hypothetical protein